MRRATLDTVPPEEQIVIVGVSLAILVGRPTGSRRRSRVQGSKRKLLE